MRLLTVLSGLLLVATGVFAIANQGVTFLAFAFIIGIVMIVSGIIQASGYIYGRYTNREIIPVEKADGDWDALNSERRIGERRRTQKNAHGWIMIDGTVTLILGILVLSNQLKAEIAVVSVFGMWMLNAGIRRVITSSYIDRKLKARNYYWTLATGLLNSAAGIYAFYNTSIFQFPLATLLGGFFVLQGISTLELAIHMPHRTQKNNILIDIEEKIQRTLVDRKK